jgi:hypothetical protein
MRIGRISQILAPRYGYCLKCKTTWKFVKHHTTMITSEHGMFPLCQKCWQETSVEDRLPFYRKLWDRWERSFTWEDVSAAVRREKAKANCCGGFFRECAGGCINDL